MEITEGTTFLTNYFPIYMFGDIEMLMAVMNSIAMFFNDRTLFDTFFSIAITISFAISAYQFMTKSDTSKGVVANIIFTLILFVSFNVKCTVELNDARSKIGQAVVGGGPNITKIDNIPYPIALLASLFSVLSHEAVLKFETIFHLDVEAPKYTEFGFMKHLQYTQSRTQVFEAEKAVVEWNDRFSKYIRNCIGAYGTSLDKAMVLNKVTLTGIDPRKLEASKITDIKQMTINGKSCTQAYDELIAEFQKGNVKSAIKNGLMRGIQAGNDQAFTNIADKAQYLNLMLKDEVTGYPEYVNGLLNPYLQASATTALRSASLGLGGGVSGSGALGNAEAYMNKRRIDGSSVGTWLVANRYIEVGTNFILLVSYLIFPFIALVSLFKNFAGKLLFFRNYIGGMFILNFMPIGLLITHNICMKLLNKNIAEKIIANAGGEAIFNAEYFAEIGDMAMISTLLGGAVAMAIPAVVLTGGVDKLFSLLGRTMPLNVGDAESYLRQSASAKTDDYVASTVGTTAGGMERAMLTMDMAQQGGSKLGNWNEMEGERANKGATAMLTSLHDSEASNATASTVGNRSLDYIASGTWSGTQQASSQLETGRIMNEGHRWMSEGGEKFISGQSLAIGAGAMQGQMMTAGARAGAEALILDGHGNISGKEGEAYAQGLINTQRIQQNQTIGLGKQGTLSHDDMINIQRVAAAGYVDQVAKGEALRKEYGTSDQVIGDGYKKDAITMARDKMKSFKAMTGKLRKTYGDDLTGRDRILGLKAEEQLQSEMGSAEAYDKAQKQAEGAGLVKDPARVAAEIEAKARYQGVEKKIAPIVEKQAEKLGEDIQKEHKKNTNKQFMEDIRNVSATKGDSGAILKNRKNYDIDPRVLEKTQAYAQGRIQEFENTSLNRAIDKIADDMAKQDAMNYQSMSANIAGLKDMGMVGNNGYTAPAMQALRMQAHEQGRVLQGYNKAFENIDGVMYGSEIFGMSPENKTAMTNAFASGGSVAASAMFNKLTAGHTLKGHYGDRVFSVNVGDAAISRAASGMSSSQVSISGGFVGNMGHVSAAAAFAVAGHSGVRTTAAIDSGINFATSVASNIQSFAGGGVVNQAVRTVGSGIRSARSRMSSWGSTPTSSTPTTAPNGMQITSWSAGPSGGGGGLTGGGGSSGFGTP